MNDLMTAREAAAILHISTRDVDALVSQRAIAFYNFRGDIRFDLADVQACRPARQRLQTPRILRETERLRQRIPEAERPPSTLTPQQLAVAQKRQRRVRMPPWADAKAIRAIYAEAKRLTEATGVPHQVDHVIPLRGDFVSGLHVAGNLQILTGSENSRKKNRFEIEP